MKVELLRYTPDALDLLLETKNTRLSNANDPPSKWPMERKLDHLAYMRDTIASSWEMVDYVFRISDVTRIYTHQHVRHRHGSYAQQSMRTARAGATGEELDVSMPKSVYMHASIGPLNAWSAAEHAARDAYKAMLAAKIPAQDARGILPQNVLTNIIAKHNLRELHNMAKLRLCTRTQGEFQDVFRAMRERVLEVHPWADEFIQVHCAATGTCAFPRYGKKECPVYEPAMDVDEVKARARARFWAVRYEAKPVAIDGKAM